MKQYIKRRPRISAYEASKHHKKGAGTLISLYAFFLSAAFLIATPIAMKLTGETELFGENLFRILTSPSKLVTDYFKLGGLGSTFFNAAICGLACNLIILISRTKANATTFAGYMLVVAHCFYGLNFFNMWPPFFGVLIYCKVMRKPFRENLHIALFSTALAPFISDFAFRYTLGDEFVLGEPKITALGVIFALLFGLAAGFVVPALLPGTTAMHRGFNMYKAGLALGILGIFIYSFLYYTLGIKSPEHLNIHNPAYDALPYAYRGFMNVFFIILFTLTIFMGFAFNNFSFKGYRQLLRSTGYGTDFLDKFGMPVCLINVGIYGLCIVAYLNLIFILPEIFPFLPEGVGFTGATVGVTFAALTFAADGQHPRTVAPIAIGYALLLALVCVICGISGMDIPWTLSTQAYINGLAFSTGLCTFSGKYGWKIGVLAGFISAIICTSTADMHGGFVLYNGGFNAGLSALVLLPILDFYKVKPKYDDDI
ncbi:MAG: DUF1576 domain-containing protein [Ruminococcaceae bacterium]|nr:DUF1576 domain-containing protein [Oscillospiraceae bacterium]